jgi:ADP-ribose pyrophosphatase YjhB (NUDIX family)
MKFTTFEKNNTSFRFIPSLTTPSEIQVTAVANIAQLDSNFVIITDKDNQDNFVFGHVEIDENLLDTVIRESREEAGVEVYNITQIGYILAEQNQEIQLNSKYPKLSAINVYHSFVKSSNSNWNKHETLSRELFSYKKAISVLSKRDDNNQLVEILDYVQEFIQKSIINTKFQFMEKVLNPEIPVSQVFNFTKNADGLYCIVKDFDENNYSLPGGGCNLGEDWKSCSARETLEEAQISTKNTTIIGVYMLSYIGLNGIMHQVQHIRTFSECYKIDIFIPRKNGFETIERKFLPKEDLKKNVEWLKYDGGEYLLKQLS